MTLASTHVYRGIRTLVCPVCGTELEIRRAEAGVMLTTGVFLPHHGQYRASCCGKGYQAPDGPSLRLLVEDMVNTLMLAVTNPGGVTLYGR
jgi:hypothetical protein